MFWFLSPSVTGRIKSKTSTPCFSLQAEDTLKVKGLQLAYWDANFLYHFILKLPTMFYSTGYIAVALQDEDSPRTQGNYIYIKIQLIGCNII